MAKLINISKSGLLLINLDNVTHIEKFESMNHMTKRVEPTMRFYFNVPIGAVDDSAVTADQVSVTEWMTPDEFFEAIKNAVTV